MHAPDLTCGSITGPLKRSALEGKMEWGPVTGWIAGLLGAASLAYTILNNRRAQLKRITWDVLADQLVMPQHPSARWEQLTVHLGQDKIDQPRVVTVEFKNAGKVELKKDDFDSPISVRVEDGAIKAAVAEGFDRGSKTSKPVPLGIQPGDQAVVVENRLFNPGDRIVVRMLLDNSLRPIVPDFKAGGFDFQGHDDLEETDEDEAKESRLSIVLGVILPLLFLAFAAFGVFAVVKTLHDRW